MKAKEAAENELTRVQEQFDDIRNHEASQKIENVIAPVAPSVREADDEPMTTKQLAMILDLAKRVGAYQSFRKEMEKLDSTELTKGWAGTQIKMLLAKSKALVRQRSRETGR